MYRFSDQICVNCIITLFFPFWIIVWIIMVSFKILSSNDRLTFVLIIHLFWLYRKAVNISLWNTFDYDFNIVLHECHTQYWNNVTIIIVFYGCISIVSLFRISQFGHVLGFCCIWIFPSLMLRYVRPIFSIGLVLSISIMSMSIVLNKKHEILRISTHTHKVTVPETVTKHLQFKI